MNGGRNGRRTGGSLDLVEMIGKERRCLRSGGILWANVSTRWVLVFAFLTQQLLPQGNARRRRGRKQISLRSCARTKSLWRSRQVVRILRHYGKTLVSGVPLPHVLDIQTRHLSLLTGQKAQNPLLGSTLRRGWFFITSRRAVPDLPQSANQPQQSTGRFLISVKG